MHAATTEAVRHWPRLASLPTRQPVPSDPTPTDEELWMQNEDVASAWAVSALTGAAVVLLIVLALLG